MRSPLVNRCIRFLSVRIAFVAALTLLLSGWTCNAMFQFDSCQGVVSQPQISSLSPGIISGGAESVPLTVEGSGFTPQAQILWNGSALETTFTDSSHLHTTITQQTFLDFGGSPGGSVQISVRSQGSVAGSGCPRSGSSSALDLVID